MVNLYLEKYNVDEGSRRPGTDQRGWLLSFSVAGLDQAFMQIFINYGEWLLYESKKVSYWLTLKYLILFGGIEA